MTKADTDEYIHTVAKEIGAPEKLQKWYEEFWQDIGRKDEIICNPSQNNGATNAADEERQGLQPLEPESAA